MIMAEEVQGRGTTGYDSIIDAALTLVKNYGHVVSPRPAPEEFAS